MHIPSALSVLLLLYDGHSDFVPSPIPFDFGRNGAAAPSTIAAAPPTFAATSHRFAHATLLPLTSTLRLSPIHPPKPTTRLNACVPSCALFAMPSPPRLIPSPAYSKVCLSHSLFDVLADAARADATPPRLCRITAATACAEQPPRGARFVRSSYPRPPRSSLSPSPLDPYTCPAPCYRPRDLPHAQSLIRLFLIPHDPFFPLPAAHYQHDAHHQRPAPWQQRRFSFVHAVFVSSPRTATISLQSHSHHLTRTPGPRMPYTTTTVPSRLDDLKYHPRITTRAPGRVPNPTRLPPACAVPAQPFTIAHTAFVAHPLDRQYRTWREGGAASGQRAYVTQPAPARLDGLRDGCASPCALDACHQLCAPLPYRFHQRLVCDVLPYPE
ncbi:hypothetical protein B0H19DRAFT_1263110 [Mycena capillaripes]|nr:hypothetical protein B0H19DRAFT_1263110 [Mycena capillaripes]